MWDLTEPTARLRIDAIAASIHLEQPERGFHDLSVSGCEIPCQRLLGIIAPFASPSGHLLDEVFVRGADLIATYSRSVESAIRPQIYWRVSEILLSNFCCLGIELIVSVETNLLDSDPTVDVVTDLSCDGVWRLVDQNSGEFEELGETIDEEIQLVENVEASLILFRPVDAPVSYVEVVPRADYQSGSLKRSGMATTWCCRLFKERLEKGVSRRGRVWGIFVPRSDDLNMAHRCFYYLNQLAPPLTA